MAESVISIREHVINSVKQLDEYIQKSAEERQSLQDKIKEMRPREKISLFFF